MTQPRALDMPRCSKFLPNRSSKV
uniref:Uncharacterized protein n=1 Tax=Arundo donax TaxID=35708 RepID=A0A0A9FQL9_ARUDO